MSLAERLTADMKDAMRAKEAGKRKLSVIRMVKAAIKNQEIDKGAVLTEEDIMTVLNREVKQRRDSIVEYEKANRMDTVSELEAEIAILLEYLPKQLTKEEIEAIVVETIAEVGASSPKDMGKLMGKLMPKVKGKADGKLVNEIVKEKLEG